MRGSLTPSTSASVIPAPMTHIHSSQSGGREETPAFPRAEDAFYPKESAPDSLTAAFIGRRTRNRVSPGLDSSAIVP